MTDAKPGGSGEAAPSLAALLCDLSGGTHVWHSPHPATEPCAQCVALAERLAERGVTVGRVSADAPSPDHDGSTWDCVECGTNVTGPSVALPCPKCGGRMVKRVECPDCSGHGVVPTNNMSVATGELLEQTCVRCQGRGSVSRGVPPADDPRWNNVAWMRETIQLLARGSQGVPEIREAQEAIKFLLKIAPEWKPDGPGGPLKCFSCGGYASSGHKPSCIVDSQFRRARTALGEGRPE